jgi:hypothetical protein
MDHLEARAPTGYFDATRADLAELPDELAGRAILQDQGEAIWPREAGEGVVDALVDAGFVIRGVEDCARNAAGAAVRRDAMGCYENGDLEESRRLALHAVNSPSLQGDQLCVVWEPSAWWLSQDSK